MTSPASDSLQEIHARLDERVKKVDEERWLSSRYADVSARTALSVLYAFNYELARIRVAVSDQTLGAIRFEWWREALQELSRGEPRQHEVVLALAGQVSSKHLQIGQLRALVDGYETAFEEHDRSLEPEVVLATLAAHVVSPGAELDPRLLELASTWAGLRRGEQIMLAQDRFKVPTELRPALAHFRLRRPWARGAALTPFRTRICVLLGVLTGDL